jgi:hypothetical protein
MKNFITLASIWEEELGKTHCSKGSLLALSLFMRRSDYHILALNVEMMYSVYGGMPDNCYDKDEFSFWSCEKAVARSLKILPKHEILCFGDFLVEAIVYGVRLTGEHAGKVVIVSRSVVLEYVACSLEEFFGFKIEEPLTIGIV